MDVRFWYDPAMRDQETRLRARFGRLGLVVGLSLSVGGTATGYRFSPSRDGVSLIPEADEARRWSDKVWGPGRVQDYVIADHPG